MSLANCVVTPNCLAPIEKAVDRNAIELAMAEITSLGLLTIVLYIALEAPSTVSHVKVDNEKPIGVKSSPYGRLTGTLYTVYRRPFFTARSMLALQALY